MKSKNWKVAEMDEYYADDGIAPQWRVDKYLGTSIN